MKAGTTLNDLAAALRSKPMTAREVATFLQSCVPTAYDWINRLRERGEAVFTMKSTSKRTGPRATVYGIR